MLALLNGDGEEARIVGGAVRNALMGLPVGEIDIATTALPDEVMRRASAAGIKSVPTGVEHGTVTLVVEGQPFEVTTLREDVETFGRKAKVAFGRDWVRDASAAISPSTACRSIADGTVHDHVGGLADIAARRVRFIGDPDRRIAEDYLRILRFFRIHAAYGAGEPDRDGYLACIRGRAGLATLSAERVRMEMLKLLVAEGAAGGAGGDGGWRACCCADLGGVAYRGPLAAMIAAERALGLAPDPMRRLAALAVAVTEDAKRRSQRDCGSPMPRPRRWIRWAIAGGGSAAWTRQPRGGGCTGSARTRYRDRLMLAWARAGGGADAGAVARTARPCRSAGPRRYFR